MNAAIHMRDDKGTTYYSFSLDKSGCVTQLPCVFGPALRGDGSGPGQARVNFDFTPLVRGDVYAATTSSSSPPARSEWEC